MTEGRLTSHCKPVCFARLTAYRQKSDSIIGKIKSPQVNKLDDFRTHVMSSCIH